MLGVAFVGTVRLSPWNSCVALQTVRMVG
jgi:hypothetical protein